MSIHRTGFTLVELLVVIGVLAVLVGLLLPAVQKVRSAASRIECANNLKQIGVAIHNFHQANGVFPASGWTGRGPGNPAGKYVGWRALVLPFLEQQNLQQAYDFNRNWWEGINLEVGALGVSTYRCPSVPNREEIRSAVGNDPRPAITFPAPIAPTDYEAIMGVQPRSINPHLSHPIYNSGNRFSIMYRNSRTTARHVADGLSSTIMVVECGARPLVFRRRQPERSLSNDQGIGWIDSEGAFSLDGASGDGEVEGCGPDDGCTFAMNRKNDNEPFSFHAGGGNYLYGDGHVQYVRDSVPLTLLASLCTATGGEIVNATD